MKSLKIFLLCLLPLSLMGQEKEIRQGSDIDNVMLFLNNAQINRSASVQLKGGANKVVFENLPQWIDQQSLQVSGKGNFTILSVAFQVNYLRAQEKSDEVKGLEKTLENLNSDLRGKQATREVIASEEAMLRANQSIGGAQTGLKVEELRAAADFYRTRMTDIKARMVKTDEEITKVKEEIAKVQSQLQTLQGQGQQPTGEVVLSVSAPADVRAAISFSYMVQGAGWVPGYDIRATDVSSPLTMACKAQVYQNTGEDWKNVKLTLSTGNPTQSGTKPNLTPWYLGFYTPYVDSRYQSFNAVPLAETRKMMDSEMAYADMAYEEVAVMPTAMSTANYTRENEGATSIEYAISVPYSVPSGGSQTVEYKKYELPAVYEYYAVRKLDKDAFLLAKATKWEELNLLAGEASLFFEGTFVGKSYIDPRMATDTLELSLGRDKGIIITRVKGQDYASRQAVGSSQKEVRSWDLTVRNTKRQSVAIVLEDQLPVPTDKDIEVTALDISKATYDKNTGKLSWRMQLAPGESRTMNVKYEVKYPKNKQVVLE